MWWEPALVATEHREQLAPIFYRIHIRQMTGRRAMPDPVEAAASAASAPTAEESWLGSLLHHWNRAATFVIFEPQQATTEALVKLPQTDQTDALLRNSGLEFSYDRLRDRYRLRLGTDDMERSANLLTELMKKAQRAGAEVRVQDRPPPGAPVARRCGNGVPTAVMQAARGRGGEILSADLRVAD